MPLPTDAVESAVTVLARVRLHSTSIPVVRSLISNLHTVSQGYKFKIDGCPSLIPPVQLNGSPHLLLFSCTGSTPSPG